MSQTSSTPTDTLYRALHHNRDCHAASCSEPPAVAPLAHTIHAEDINQWLECTQKSDETRELRSTWGAVTPKIASMTSPKRGQSSIPSSVFGSDHTCHEGIPNRAPESAPLDTVATPKRLHSL
jgi:hypothetical protein